MPKKDTRITVLGDGGWGTTLSLLLADKGFRVCLWGAFPAYIDEVRRTRENTKFLPGFKIPENVSLTSSIKDALKAADLLVLAVPAQHLRSVLMRLKKEGAAKKKYVIVGKGIETSSLKTLSQILREILGSVPVAVVSGPNIAREVALKVPGAASVASSDAKFASRVREIFETKTFCLFETQDVLGVELGGALKNVIAIGSGIAEGMGYGDNTRAVFFARGVAEMARLGKKMGARRETFMGLSGLGDLATTCLSPHSRNHRLGIEIGKGKKLEQILKQSEMVVEGVETARSARRLSAKYKVAMPICETVYKILFKNVDPRQLIDALWKGGERKESD